jgi:peptidyl-dipeptidase A
MRRWLAVAILLGGALGGCAHGPEGEAEPAAGARPEAVRPAGAERAAQRLVARHVVRLQPLARELNHAYWSAARSGRAADYERVAGLEIRIRRLHADADVLRRLRALLADEGLRDTELRRQLELLVALFRENQLPAEQIAHLVRAGLALERAYAAHRFTLDGQPIAANGLYAVLAHSDDPERRRAAWEALQARGGALRAQLLAVVRQRNRAARGLGFTDYRRMRLELDEIDPDWLRELVAELDQRSRGLQAALMRRLRVRLARRWDIQPEAVAPWHFEDPEFQRPPTGDGLRLDPVFGQRSPVALAVGTARRLGFDPAPVLEGSDLEERPGKTPYAFCLALDRLGDVRLLANVRPGVQWTATMLHELGHGLFHAGVDPRLPWLLRQPAHPVVSEAVAVVLGRLVRQPVWLKRLLGLGEQRLRLAAPVLELRRRRARLVYLRHALVLVHFERGLYRDPDQDLDALWWRLKERYQGIARPAGHRGAGWAGQAHLVLAPASAHQGLLGHLLASQLERHLAAEFGAWPRLGPEVGDHLRRTLFAPGASLRWDALWHRRIGRAPGPEAFLEQLALDRPAAAAGSGGGRKDAS